MRRWAAVGVLAALMTTAGSGHATTAFAASRARSVAPRLAPSHASSGRSTSASTTQTEQGAVDWGADGWFGVGPFVSVSAFVQQQYVDFTGSSDAVTIAATRSAILSGAQLPSA